MVKLQPSAAGCASLACVMWTALAYGDEPHAAMAPPVPEPPTTLILAVDLYATTLGGTYDVAGADVATSLEFERGSPATSTQLRVDAVFRESLTGGLPRRELHELQAAFALGSRLRLRLGRQRLAGGFWLFADGATLQVRLGAGHSLEATGGLRSFTNARAEQLLRASPHLMPLAALAWRLQAPGRSAGVLAVATQDEISVARGLEAPSGRADEGASLGTPLRYSTTLPEALLDANGMWQVRPGLTIYGAATLGHRYHVAYDARPLVLGNEPTVYVNRVRAGSLLAALDYQPGVRHRLHGSLIAVRAKTTFGLANPTQKSPNTGTFAEAAVRHTYRRSDRTPWRWQNGLRVRQRDNAWVLRPSTMLEAGPAQGASIRGELGVDWRTRVATGPDFTARRTWLANGQVRFGHQRNRPHYDLRAGIFFVGYLPSSALSDLRTNDPASLKLFPFTLEAQRFGYVRAFASWQHWFAGLDLEHALGERQLRAFWQDEGWLPHAAATLETFDANGGRMALALLHHTRTGADMGTWFWFEELHGATRAVGWGNAERARSTCVGCHSTSPDAPLWWLSPPKAEVP